MFLELELAGQNYMYVYKDVCSFSHCLSLPTVLYSTCMYLQVHVATIMYCTCTTCTEALSLHVEVQQAVISCLVSTL